MNIKEKDLVEFQLHGDNLIGMVTEVYNTTIGMRYDVQYFQDSGTHIYSGHIHYDRQNVSIYYPEMAGSKFAKLLILSENFDLYDLPRETLVKFRNEIIWLLITNLTTDEIKTIKQRLDNAILTKDFRNVVYLVNYDNGEVYSDNNHWVERVFSREQDAFEFVESNKNPNGYNHYSYFAMGVE